MQCLPVQPPFDIEAGDGKDLGTDDAIVRSGDLTRFSWNVSASAEQPLADSFATAIFEQTIVLGPDAVANFTGVPAVCERNSPRNKIVAYAGDSDKVGAVIKGGAAPPSGTTKVVMSCVLGANLRDAVTLENSVWASPDSVNGSKFSTSTRIYAVDPNGVVTAQPDGPIKTGPIEITSVPRYDLHKGTSFSSGWGNFTVDGKVITARTVLYPILISTDRKVGIEGFEQPVTFTEDFFAKAGGDTGPTSLQDRTTLPLILWLSEYQCQKLTVQMVSLTTVGEVSPTTTK